tara:strand:- start:130 stop:441 length:312 start_codon:yes stop_codon:yes gene_type:complete
VIDHSLNADGIVEEYYVDYKDELISVPADEAKVIVAESHGDEEEDADEDKKKKEDEEHDDKDKDEDEEELNSIREAYGLNKKRKGPHGEKPKLNCRSVHAINY